MALLRRIIPLLFATTTALGQLAQQSKPPSVPTEPGVVVRSLYSEVVARHPVGIPKDADMKIFTPYLSKALLHRIDSANACGEDYYRQHPDPNLKPDIAWLEFGLFTGGMEQAAPQKFRVLGAERQKNGSFRVYVELMIMYGLPTNPEPSVWYVAAIVVRENGQFVVDDVIFLKDYSTLENEFRLSEVLRAGCHGPRWVGYSKQPNGVKQQR
jgi:hypothetical protein